jgi:YrbI family 3-deoxy-D-manno-octulosonate 8-phosphate phosphatase
MLVDLTNIHTIVFDFDGVFTDNYVYSDSTGNEIIRCSKEDSYGLDLLKNYIAERNPSLEIFVLSTETNQVVDMRCKKMGIKLVKSIKNKSEFMENWLIQYRADYELPFQGVVFFGNDMNDFEVMKKCGLSFSPSDANPRVKQISTFVLSRAGGEGFVREGVELLLGISSELETTE